MRVMFIWLLAGCAYALCFGQVTGTSEQIELQSLADNLHQTLADSARGWGFQIYRGMERVASEAGGFRVASIDNNDEGSIPFTPEHRMHIASISKSITAIAAITILRENGLDLSVAMWDYLPKDWIVHPSLRETTFADLLEMRTGLSAHNDALTSGYESLRVLVAQGVHQDAIGKFNYQNVSYGLLRVLIGALHERSTAEDVGTVSVNASSTSWSYVSYVNKAVLAPAGVSPATCAPGNSHPTMMYAFTCPEGPGLLSGYSGEPESDGDLTDYAGGIGWYLSIDDLGKLFTTLFHSGKILGNSDKQVLFELRFPFNTISRDWGNFISGMGMWIWKHSEGDYNCGLNTIYVLFPDDVLVVAFVNSTGKGIRNLRARTLTAYENSRD